MDFSHARHVVQETFGEDFLLLADSAEVARQLTTDDFSAFEKIDAREYLAFLWDKGKTATPNIDNLTARSNKVRMCEGLSVCVCVCVCMCVQVLFNVCVR